MKRFAKGLVVGAAGLVVVQWWQIAYRLNLFFGECHSERGVNHIGGDTFMLIYIINAILLLGAIVSLWVFWKSSRIWRAASGIIGALNAIGWSVFFTMHRMGVLVTYEEFIRHRTGM